MCAAAHQGTMGNIGPQWPLCPWQESNNDENACRHHTGAPVFHDTRKCRSAPRACPRGASPVTHGGPPQASGGRAVKTRRCTRLRSCLAFLAAP